MNSSTPPRPAPREESKRRSRMGWLMVLCCLVLVLAALLRGRRQTDPGVQRTAASPPPPVTASSDASARDRLFARMPPRGSNAEPEITAAQIVSNKLAQFTRHRHDVLDAMARKLKVEVPDEVKRFFEAAEAGNWDEIDAVFKTLVELKKTDGPENPTRLWGPILDTDGVAEQAHNWPAQKLLDYGHAVLDSLRPGMVYIGGTDEGRWIPELLNDTSEGEQHIIVTQIAFADATYLNYVSELYGDRITTLTQEDSQKAFKDYLADAQNRFHHDEQFPDETKQVRPGEDIQVKDNRVQVGGQVAVTAINYSKLALGQANLLADHQYSAEAEQAYRLSTQIWPGNLESASDLSELLLRTGRADEARSLMDDFEHKFPDQKVDVEKARALWKFIAPAPGTSPRP